MLVGLLLVWLSVAWGDNPLLDPYSQTSSRRFTVKGFPKTADWTSLSFAAPTSLSTLKDGSFSFLSDGRVYQYTNQGAFSDVTSLYPGVSLGTGSKMSLCSGKELALVVADPETIYFCRGKGEKCDRLFLPMGPINAVVEDPLYSRILVASENGIFAFDSTTPYKFSRAEIGNVTSIAIASDGTIAAGSTNLLWRTLRAGDLSSFHFFRAPGLLDATPSGLAFDASGNLWIANEVCVNVQAKDFTFRRVSGQSGLPQGNLTSIDVQPTNQQIWFSSVYGVIMFDAVHEKWHYYYGPAYLAGRNITSGQNIHHVLSISPNEVVAVSDVGFSFLQTSQMTLEDKADYLLRFGKYFRSPSPEPHPYHGYLVGDVGLKYFGNLSSWIPESNDNNGLWTSVYLAGLCFQYDLLKSPAIKEEAWKYFEGLEFLNKVTGVKGLMARSVLYQDNIPNFGTWYHSRTNPGWIWKADTSSDEVCGHLMVYPLVYRLLAETPAEKNRVAALIYDITRYIVENDFQLIDVTGKPTTWGRWDPYSLNQQSDWYIQRGLNSLQIVSWLVSAYSITNDTIFSDAYRFLVEEHGYGINIVNSKVEDPADVNYSDDELEFLAYLPYFFSLPYLKGRDLLPSISSYMASSMDRSFAFVGKYRPSPWNAIYYLYTKSLAHPPPLPPAFVEDTIQTLREWPMDIINWPHDNSHRLDVLPDPEANRFGTSDWLTLLPYNELRQLRWNADPYNLSPGGSGTSATDPGGYIFAYWLTRWAGIGI